VTVFFWHLTLLN